MIYNITVKRQLLRSSELADTWSPGGCLSIAHESSKWSVQICWELLRSESRARRGLSYPTAHALFVRGIWWKESSCSGRARAPNREKERKRKRERGFKHIPGHRRLRSFIGILQVVRQVWPGLCHGSNAVVFALPLLSSSWPELFLILRLGLPPAPYLPHQPACVCMSVCICRE